MPLSYHYAMSFSILGTEKRESPVEHQNVVQGEVCNGTDRTFKTERELRRRVKSKGVEEEKTKPLDLVIKRITSFVVKSDNQAGGHG